MKIRFLHLLILIIVISSCNQGQEFKMNRISSFPINKELTGEVIKLDSMPVCPRNFDIIGNYLVFLNEDKCYDKMFHVFNKSTFQFLGSFGTEGRGPNELISPIMTGHIVNNDTLSGAWIKNQKNKRFELVNIKNSLNEKQYIIEDNYFRVPLNEGGYLGYRIDDENIIVCSIDGKNGRFYTYNLKNYSTKWVGFIPKISGVKSTLPDDEISGIYTSRNAISKDYKFFVSAVFLAKRIDIFNSQLDHQVSIEYEDSPKNIKWPTGPAEDDSWHNTYGYFSRNIYIDNSNLIYTIMKKVSISGRVTNDNAELHVFSMDGTAKARYVLDVNQKVIYFAIDEESGSLFCLYNTEDGTPKIIRYGIPR